MSPSERQPVNDTLSATPQWLVPPPGRSAETRRLFTAHAVIGTACVIVGGLVAAITGPLDWAQGSWLAAYLVLVGGVAQVAIGAAPYFLSPAPPAPWAGRSLLTAWNAGNALVIGGTLGRSALVVDAGGVALLAALLLALRAVAGGRRSAVLASYRAVLVLLAISVPVGLVLAHLRSG